MKKNMTFEAAMDRLDEIVAALESGRHGLDDSLKLFGEGAELLGFCDKKIESARLTVEKLFVPSAQEVQDE